MKLLHHWLAESLGHAPKVFIDYNIDTGNSWPYALAHALARSKVLVALWSPMYFSSEWCTSELAHMYTREKQCGFRTVNRPYGLIVPASIHDGENFPQDAKAIQMVELQECSNVCIAPNSPTEEELSKRIRAWTPNIAQAIQRAPTYDPIWQNLAFNDFLNLFTQTASEQTTLPSLGDV